MKTQYQYIHFEEEPTKGKTKVFSCKNNNSLQELGKVKWYGPWRQYCYFSTCQAVYSRGCNNDINHFIDQLMEERKS